MADDEGGRAIRTEQSASQARKGQAQPPAAQGQGRQGEATERTTVDML